MYWIEGINSSLKVNKLNYTLSLTSTSTQLLSKFKVLSIK